MPSRSHIQMHATGRPPIDRSRAVCIYVVVARETCNSIHRSNSNSKQQRADTIDRSMMLEIYTVLYCRRQCGLILSWVCVHSTVTSTFLCQPGPLSSISAQFVTAVDSYAGSIGSDGILRPAGRPASMGMANTRQRCACMASSSVAVCDFHIAPAVSSSPAAS
jgi:hypothetical protein